MTAYIAATVRRYVSEFAILGRTEAFVGELDIRDAATINEEKDLPGVELYRLFDYLATTGPAGSRFESALILPPFKAHS